MLGFEYHDRIFSEQLKLRLAEAINEELTALDPELKRRYGGLCKQAQLMNQALSLCRVWFPRRPA